jgi:hypothetical protein
MSSNGRFLRAMPRRDGALDHVCAPMGWAIFDESEDTQNARLSAVS